MMTDYVYLLHFSKPIAPGRHTAQHYLGSADDVYARLLEHRAGKGARLCQVANERGIEYNVVRIWVADPGQGRQLERKLKNRKMGNRLCPICAARHKDRQPEAIEFTLDDLQNLPF